MSAYVIAEVEVIDEVKARPYRDLAAASISKHGGRYLVRAARPDLPEGEWPPQHRMALIEFPTMDAVRAWYDSREYAAALAVRGGALAPQRLVFVEGVD
jgi:uncharacterized protein (DUF1330 family)